MPGSKDPLIGPEAYQQAVDFFFMAFPKGKMNIDEVFAEGGRVCLLYTFTGIHEANFNGIEATNRKLEFSGVGIGRISEGKIEEIVSIFDNASLFAALAN
jgi:predicted ester cyclase